MTGEHHLTAQGLFGCRRGATIRAMSDPIPDSDWSANCCAWCHFFARATLKDAPRSWDEITSLDRRHLAGRVNTDSPLVVGKGFKLACYHGVWDLDYVTEDAAQELTAKFAETLTRERGYSCFFYSHTPGMSFPAAEELEGRQADRREAEADRRLTRKSLRQSRKAFLVAVVALAVSIVATVANLLWNIWQHFHALKP